MNSLSYKSQSAICSKSLMDKTPQVVFVSGMVWSIDGTNLDEELVTRLLNTFKKLEPHGSISQNRVDMLWYFLCPETKRTLKFRDEPGNREEIDKWVEEGKVIRNVNTQS